MTKPRSIAKGSLREKGTVLIEAMIAFVIVSLGILGIIGLQAQAIKTVSEAGYRSSASALASELVGMMWGDLANVASYNWTGGAAPAQMAGWYNRVTTQLPGAAANPPTVVVGTTTVDGRVIPNVVTITVRWLPPGKGSGAVASRHVEVAYVNSCLTC